MRLDRRQIRTVYLVARRELLTRVRNRFFLVSTLVLVVIMVGYIELQAHVFSGQGSSVTAGFTGPAAALREPLVRESGALGTTMKTRSEPNVAAGEADVRSGTIDLLVSGSVTAPDVAVQDKLDLQVSAALTALARQVALNAALSSRGVDAAAVTADVAAAGPRVRTLDPGAAQRAERSVAGIIVAILLYVLLLMYGQVVAGGVVEEK